MVDSLIVAKKRKPEYLLLTFEAARLDPANCAVLQSELASGLAADPIDMIVDMGAIAYAVSPAVNVILDAHERCRKAGRMMVLIRVQPSVRRILSLSGLGSVLVMRETMAEAIDLLKSARE